MTNTGPTILNGDLGVSPGTAITGFPPGIVNGATHGGDAAAAGAQSDLTTAYNDAAGRTPAASVGGFIGAGQTLLPGVYNASSSLDVGGSLTLDAQGDPSAVFIFQVGSTLVTDSASQVILTGGAQACNIFWQVGSSATLGTGSSFQGTILALTSITVTTGDTVQGRALARNGAVTLDDDVITAPTCATGPTPTANRAHTHPNRAHTHPNRAHTHPNRAHTHPNRAHTHPNRAHTHPNRAHTHPNRAHTHPNRAHTHPNRAHTHPNRAHTHPNRAHTHPNRAHTHPNRAHTDAEPIAITRAYTHPHTHHCPGDRLSA